MNFEDPHNLYALDSGLMPDHNPDAIEGERNPEELFDEQGNPIPEEDLPMAA